MKVNISRQQKNDWGKLVKHFRQFAIRPFFETSYICALQLISQKVFRSSTFWAKARSHRFIDVFSSLRRSRPCPEYIWDCSIPVRLADFDFYLGFWIPFYMWMAWMEAHVWMTSASVATITLAIGQCVAWPATVITETLREKKEKKLTETTTKNKNLALSLARFQRPQQRIFFIAGSNPRNLAITGDHSK